MEGEPRGAQGRANAEGVLQKRPGVRTGKRQLWGWDGREDLEPGARRHLPAGPCARAHLGIGILNAVIHQHHDEDRDGHPKVPNHPPHLWASSVLRGPPPRSSPDSVTPSGAPLLPPCSLWHFSPHTRPGKNRLFLNLRRKKAIKKVPAMSTSDSRAVLG